MLIIDQKQCCICYLEDFFVQDELDSQAAIKNHQNKSTQDDIKNPDYIKLNGIILLNSNAYKFRIFKR